MTRDFSNVVLQLSHKYWYLYWYQQQRPCYQENFFALTLMYGYCMRLILMILVLDIRLDFRVVLMSNGLSADSFLSNGQSNFCYASVNVKPHRVLR